MYFKQTILSLVLVSSLVQSAPRADSNPSYGPPPPPIEHSKGMPYDFAYRVDDDLTENHYGHNEASDGTTVTGEYRVLLPDGRTQIVRYHADHNTGFVADVSYEGEAYFAPAPPSISPSYGPALIPSPTPRPYPPPPSPSIRPAPFSPAPPQLIGDSYLSPSNSRAGNVLAPPQPSQAPQQLTLDEEEFAEYYA